MQDQLGNVYGLVKPDGTVAGYSAYDPYGNLVFEEGTQPMMAYAGLYNHDTSDLYLATYRAYDPATAHWLNRGPIREAGGLNLYAYVGGNPVNLVNPNGELAWVAAGAIVGAAFNITATIVSNSYYGKPISVKQIVAAGASGAIAGAIGAMAGPFGGSVARSLGGSSTGWLSVGANASLSAGGGYAGQVVANYVDPCNAVDPINAAVFSGLGGGMASKLIKNPGMYTVKQANYFAPRKLKSVNSNSVINSYGASSGLGLLSFIGGADDK